jgi:hypothetical protein
MLFQLVLKTGLSREEYTGPLPRLDNVIDGMESENMLILIQPALIFG